MGKSLNNLYHLSTDEWLIIWIYFYAFQLCPPTPTDYMADSGFAPANERRRYKVTPSLIGWAQN